MKKAQGASLGKYFQKEKAKKHLQAEAAKERGYRVEDRDDLGESVRKRRKQLDD